MDAKYEMEVLSGCWIEESDLPVRADLKVIYTEDPDLGLTVDEVQDRNEFIRCYLLADYEPLILIPRDMSDTDFFDMGCDVMSQADSAFNTHDFQKGLPAFNKYGYAMKKIMERVKDLAIMHSSISSSEGRTATLHRYEAFVDQEFRDQLLIYIDQHKNTEDPEQKYRIKQRIAKLNCRILECKRIWERYAPIESWDT